MRPLVATRSCRPRTLGPNAAPTNLFSQSAEDLQSAIDLGIAPPRGPPSPSATASDTTRFRSRLARSRRTQNNCAAGARHSRPMPGPRRRHHRPPGFARRATSNSSTPSPVCSTPFPTARARSSSATPSPADHGRTPPPANPRPCRRARPRRLPPSSPACAMTSPRLLALGDIFCLPLLARGHAPRRPSRPWAASLPVRRYRYPRPAREEVVPRRIRPAGPPLATPPALADALIHPRPRNPDRPPRPWAAPAAVTAPPPNSRSRSSSNAR